MCGEVYTPTGTSIKLGGDVQLISYDSPVYSNFRSAKMMSKVKVCQHTKLRFVDMVNIILNMGVLTLVLQVHYHDDDSIKLKHHCCKQSLIKLLA